MNTVILLGNLVRDPELKQLGNGNAVVNFVIAVNEKPYKDRNGETVKPVHFFDVEAFASGAEGIAGTFKKGSSILVEGMLRQHKWETNEGEKRSRVVIRCNKYSVPKFEKGKRVGSDELDAAKSGNSNEEHRPVTVTSGGSKEDIPF